MIGASTPGTVGRTLSTVSAETYVVTDRRVIRLRDGDPTSVRWPDATGIEAAEGPVAAGTVTVSGADGDVSFVGLADPEGVRGQIEQTRRDAEDSPVAAG